MDPNSLRQGDEQNETFLEAVATDHLGSLSISSADSATGDANSIHGKASVQSSR